jgi:hypothetical protein
VKLKLFAAAAATLALALAAALPAGASAAPLPRTVWVSHSTVSLADSSCAKPGFNTIQAALGAVAPGGTVFVCGGTYSEQLQITASVTLTATSGAVTLALPATPVDATTACDVASDVGDPGQGNDQDGISICGNASVAISGFDVDAAWPTTTCNDNLYGILVAGGASLVMSNSQVSAAGAVPLNGCQGGVGIQAGMDWTSPTESGHVTLSRDSVSGYQKNGITADGPGSTALISATTVTGIGPTAQIAQNGIQISNGAFGQIVGSSISGNECNDTAGGCGSDILTNAQSVGVLFYGARDGSSVTGSSISGNDDGIYTYDADPSAPHAPVFSLLANSLHNRYAGVLLDQGFTLVSANSIGGGTVGIGVLQYSGQSFAADGTATLNSISGESLAAVQVESDNQPADMPGQLTLTLNNLRGNAARVVNNSSNYTVFQAFNL